MPEQLNEVEFEYEFYSKIEDPEDALRFEAEDRLRALAEGHDDMIGASVTLEAMAENAETPYSIRAKVVAYTRPQYIVGEEKQEEPERALRAALDAVARQVREKRDQLGKPWQQP